MLKDAYISDCETYRYNLVRDWDDDKPPMLFIMLNPSTADADNDDPTIRRCLSFAEREGCGMIEVVNLFAFRATDPHELKTAPDPIGPENDGILLQAAKDCVLLNEGVIVAAWGAHGSLLNRSQAVREMLTSEAIPLKCLGTTKAGEPRHPLYISGQQPLEDL